MRLACIYEQMKPGIFRTLAQDTLLFANKDELKQRAEELLEKIIECAKQILPKTVLEKRLSSNSLYQKILSTSNEIFLIEQSQNLSILTLGKYLKKQVLPIRFNFSFEVRAWLQNPENQKHLDEVQSINLKGMGLSGEIPKEIALFRNLTYLDVRDNKFTSIASEILRLKNLTTIDAAYNCISEVPILTDSNVETFNLKYNEFRMTYEEFIATVPDERILYSILTTREGTVQFASNPRNSPMWGRKRGAACI
jgi:hypothetical protein